MPYTKIKKGKDKGKYRSERSGSVRTLGQVRAYHAKKGQKRGRG